jgi:hypothetical protein
MKFSRQAQDTRFSPTCHKFSTTHKYNTTEKQPNHFMSTAENYNRHKQVPLYTYVYVQVCLISAGNTLQHLQWLQETVDNTECYI